jgi:hypothetical protein
MYILAFYSIVERQNRNDDLRDLARRLSPSLILIVGSWHESMQIVSSSDKRLDKNQFARVSGPPLIASRNFGTLIAALIAELGITTPPPHRVVWLSVWGWYYQ